MKGILFLNNRYNHNVFMEQITGYNDNCGYKHVGNNFSEMDRLVF